MRTVPKFLKHRPTFFLLDFIDLGLLMVALIVGLFLNLLPVFALMLGGLFILVGKFLRKRVDLTALFLPNKKEINLNSLYEKDDL